jgi:hypothetical protein
MNALEFDKPEDWSIGKRTGFLSIILLFFGPMILYFLDSIFKSYSLFVSSITIILMVFLLYLNTNIFLERGGSRIRINHFILMLWGAWQFWNYIRLAAIYMTYPFGHVPYTLITGLWFTAIGFLLCMIAGMMEWKYPHVMGPRVLFGKKSVSRVPAEKEYKPEVPVRPVKSHNPGTTVTGNPGPKPATAVNGNPHPSNPNSTVLEREPTSEEEKILRRWARHIGSDGQAYEQCMKCGKYTFIRAQKSGNTVVFTCPECNTLYELNKG